MAQEGHAGALSALHHLGLLHELRFFVDLLHEPELLLHRLVLDLLETQEARELRVQRVVRLLEHDEREVFRLQVNQVVLLGRTAHQLQLLSLALGIIHKFNDATLITKKLLLARQSLAAGERQARELLCEARGAPGVPSRPRLQREPLLEDREVQSRESAALPRLRLYEERFFKNIKEVFGDLTQKELQRIVFLNPSVTHLDKSDFANINEYTSGLYS